MTKKVGGGAPRPNHLIGEKSPYLQQHAHNPVDWYPWSEEAFRRSAAENKPVFLSIGYATCHWCHVMAHESFGDAEVARILNSGFIPVKVDREERPDIDSVYMAACQQMTGHGGWPLTIIMTPDKKPFFAGTYLPRTSRAGMTGLVDLLRTVEQHWEEQQDHLVAAADQLTTILRSTTGLPPGGTADEALLQRGYHELAGSFDPINGGFGRAPKFPTSTISLFLLRYGKRAHSPHAIRMAEITLEAIRRGGIHDHIGGGFHRYATDARWIVPHFEKMLYDQALLLMAYTEAWLATKNPVFRITAKNIIAYVTRDLISPGGAFYAAEDADSDSGEGAFYLWTRAEFDAVLGPDDGAYAASVFGVIEEGNYSDGTTGSGRNILTIRAGSDQNTADMERIQIIKAKLLEARSQRSRPARDTKILTDWNGLMVAALAQASRAYSEPLYASVAETALRFILSVHQAPDGGLFHRSCEGEATITAFADDYACIIRALIEIYRTTFDPSWLEKALLLNRYLAEHFQDPEGGFFTVADTGDQLIVQRKEIYDGAVPSSNSLILGNLVLLAHLTGDPVLEQQASDLADFFAGTVGRAPSAYTAYLCGLDHLLGPAIDIVITGERTDPAVQEMIRQLQCRYHPTLTLHLRTSRSGPEGLDALAPFILPMVPLDGKATAYVCMAHTCSAPVTDSTGLLALLGEKEE